MTEKKTTYSKQIIEMADYIYAKPKVRRKHLLPKYGKAWQISDRTIDRIWKKAKEYNKIRLDKQEKIRDKVFDAEAEKSLKSSILSRNERLVILSTIASGNGRKIGDEILVPTDSDRIKAIAEMAKYEGDYAPVKTAQTDTKGNDIQEIITPEEAARFIKEMTNEYGRKSKKNTSK